MCEEEVTQAAMKPASRSECSGPAAARSELPPQKKVSAI